MEEIPANLIDRLAEAKEQGRLGEVAAVETALAAAGQKLQAMQEATIRTTVLSLGVPDIRRSVGRPTGSGT
ncbi:hypothetical protein [Nonomuraea sp. GTA35]|uniref:hypothetical protein n=1 Tax=Nonomuraea sp. GTA35 TaxID=1676746 RepID=UPI0035BFF77A